MRHAAGLTLLESDRRLSVARATRLTALGAGAQGLVVLGVMAVGLVERGAPEREGGPTVVERVFYLAPTLQPDVVPLPLLIEQAGAGGAAPASAPDDARGVAAGPEVAARGTADSGTSATSDAPEEEPVFAWSELDVDSTAVRDPESAAPVYPRALLAARVEGYALVQFVVDTLGRPSLASFRPIETTDSAFVRAVRDALPRMKFRPAWAAGQRVPQLVEQNFAFRIEAVAAARRPPS